MLALDACQLKTDRPVIKVLGSIHPLKSLPSSIPVPSVKYCWTRPPTFRSSRFSHILRNVLGSTASSSVTTAPRIAVPAPLPQTSRPFEPQKPAASAAPKIQSKKPTLPGASWGVIAFAAILKYRRVQQQRQRWHARNRTRGQRCSFFRGRWKHLQRRRCSGCCSERERQRNRTRSGPLLSQAYPGERSDGRCSGFGPGVPGVSEGRYGAGLAAERSVAEGRATGD